MEKFDQFTAEELERLTDALADSLKGAVDEAEMEWRQQALDAALAALEEKGDEQLTSSR